MSLHFSKTTYLKCLKENSLYSSDTLIEQQIKAKHTFSYGHVDRKSFNTKLVDLHASAPNFLHRAVVAIPSALISGVVKTAYHLASALIAGTWNILTGDGGDVMKKHVFSFLRDLQETFGHITSVFSYSLGQYHIQESAFHKQAYGNWSFIDTIKVPDIDIRVPTLKDEWESASAEIDALINQDKLTEAMHLADQFKEDYQKLQTKPYYQKLAWKFIAKRDLRNALLAADKVIHRLVDEEKIYVSIADLYVKDKDFKRASDITSSKLTVSFKDKDRLHHDIADGLWEIGEWEQAIQEASKMSKAEYELQGRFYEKAALKYLSNGKIDKACETIDKTYGLANNITNAFYCKLFHYHLERSDLDNAARTIEKIQRNPDLKDSLILIISTKYENILDFDKSLEQLKKIGHSNPKKKELIEGIALKYYNASQIDKCYKVLISLSKRDDGTCLLFEKIAEHYIEASEYDEALEAAWHSENLELQHQIALKIVEMAIQRNEVDKLNYYRGQIKHFESEVQDGLLKKLAEYYISKDNILQSFNLVSYIKNRDLRTLLCNQLQKCVSYDSKKYDQMFKELCDNDDLYNTLNSTNSRRERNHAKSKRPAAI